MGEPTKIIKQGITFWFTRDSWMDDDPMPSIADLMMLQFKANQLGIHRKVASYETIKPDPAKLKEWRRLRKMLYEIEASDLWEYDYGDGGGYLRKPKAETITHYAETEEEWRERVEKAWESNPVRKGGS